MDRKFNIVIFQIGDFCNKSKLYNYCIESVKKEFPNDNIMIFHSLEEIEKKFNIPHNKYYNRFIDNNIALLDYVRLYLTNYLENMIYIDVDIEVFSGFRNYICSLLDNEKDNDFFRFQYGHSCFCSRKKNNKINDFIDYFTLHCLRQKEYLPDTYFASYLEHIGLKFYFDEKVSKYLIHYSFYGRLTKKKNINFFCDLDFYFSSYLHFVVVAPVNDIRSETLKENGISINVISDEKLPEKFFNHYTDIANKWVLMSESVFEFFLQDLQYSFKDAVFFNLDDIKDMYEFEQQARNKSKEQVAFCIKKDDKVLNDKYYPTSILSNINFIKEKFVDKIPTAEDRTYETQKEVWNWG